MVENPKQAPGRNKFPLSVVPPRVLAELGAAMLEGAIKYGAFNWRSSKIFYSDYYDATTRHMMQWWEGEDNDPDSGLSHVTKAIASLTVLRDAMLNGSAIDDRPSTPAHMSGFVALKDDPVYVDPDTGNIKRSSEMYEFDGEAFNRADEPWYATINNLVKSIRERLSNAPK